MCIEILLCNMWTLHLSIDIVSCYIYFFSTSISLNPSNPDKSQKNKKHMFENACSTIFLLTVFIPLGVPKNNVHVLPQLINTLSQTGLIWLVVWNHLKNTSQLGWLFPIYGKIKNVPNHQPVMFESHDSHTVFLLLFIWGRRPSPAERPSGARDINTYVTLIHIIPSFLCQDGSSVKWYLDVNMSSWYVCVTYVKCEMLLR